MSALQICCALTILNAPLVLPDSAVASSDSTNQTGKHQQPGNLGDAEELKLRQLRRDIATLNATLADNLDEKHTLQDQLGLIEKRIGKFVTVIHGIGKKIGQQNFNLRRLQKEFQILTDHLQAQKKVLADHVRAAYVMGRQQYIKLLLNQQDPASIARTLQYHRYFNRARIDQIEVAKNSINKLDALQAQIEQNKDGLKIVRKSQVSDQQQLESDRKKRLLVLAKLDDQIAKKGTDLKRLRDDEKRLAKIIGQFTQHVTDIPALNVRSKNFKQQKGKLPWPIDGNLVAKFGNARNIGGLKWRGILISPKQNNPVQAISHGRVAFADWLKGFGQLLIIEHGNGYMSLYGHNEGLFKEVGDWVTANEPIAMIGDKANPNIGNNADGKNKGLYFEIRHKGRPKNPLRWLKRRPR